jgi:hypothetical protein
MMKKTGVLGGFVAVACACCVVLVAFMVGPGREYCPRPSSESIAALFAPCQAFDTAVGHTVTTQEAVRMAFLKPDGRLAANAAREPSPPEEIQAEERQAILREHATVGAAK